MIDVSGKWREVIALIASAPMFREMDEELLTEIANEIQWFSLPGGATLFDAGDAADALYLVISGSLGVFVCAPDGQQRFVGRVAVGETVGEMALITGGLRNATVVALRDTELGCLSRRTFEDLMLRHPLALLSIAQVIIRWLEESRGQQVRVASKVPMTIAILPSGTQLDSTRFATELVEVLRSMGRTELLERGTGVEHTSQWFFNVESANDFIVYVGDPLPTAWSKLCMRQAECVLVLTHAEMDASLPAMLTEVPKPRAHAKRTHVVLLHTAEFRHGAARRWLALSPRVHLHHVRHTADVARLARLLTGRGIGLVLSGGGARGFAHIGVIRALREATIPIDAVGGTSMGALIAAGLASGWQHEEMIERFRRTFVDTNPVNDYTLPLVSLAAGRKVARLLRGEFGDIDVEDLPSPYFCVTANLTTGETSVHRSGELVRWLRASVAIPGVLPPVIHDAAVHVDGATINNLPVDVMRAFAPGRIIGVDAGADLALRPDADTIEAPAVWKILSWLRRDKPRVNILQILWRASMVNSAANTAMQRQLTDLLISPPLESIELLDWHAFDRAIDIGYHHALEILETHAEALKA